MRLHITHRRHRLLQDHVLAKPVCVHLALVVLTAPVPSLAGAYAFPALEDFVQHWRGTYETQDWHLGASMATFNDCFLDCPPNYRAIAPIIEAILVAPQLGARQSESFYTKLSIDLPIGLDAYDHWHRFAHHEQLRLCDVLVQPELPVEVARTVEEGPVSHVDGKYPSASSLLVHLLACMCCQPDFEAGDRRQLRCPVEEVRAHPRERGVLVHVPHGDREGRYARLA